MFGVGHGAIILPAWDNARMAGNLMRALSLAVALAGLAGPAAAPAASAATELATGSVLEPRRELPEFSLLDQQGRAFTRARLRGTWSLLFFGYTSCPDVCPATLTTLAAFAAELRRAGDAVRPQVVFVGVDARRDTPAQLARYVPFFDPEFIGVAAPDQATIAALARSMGVFVMITPRRDGAWQVDHSSAIFVVDPAGSIVAILTGPFSAAALAGDFRRLVAAGR